MTEADFKTWDWHKAENLEAQRDDAIARLAANDASKVGLVAERNIAQAECKSREANQRELAEANAALTASVANAREELVATTSALDDARDQIAKVTNERDGLLEKYSPEIAAEKKKAADEAKQAEIDKALATLKGHGVDVLPAVIAPDVKA